ncbi:hypothetical protein FRC09_015062 [Ceratobasidium sp. 395]|nr:hypothetical protein FRC09_015062 [Ceratobasidium sp. 395]
MSLTGKRQNVMTPTSPSSIPRLKRPKTTGRASGPSTAGGTDISTPTNAPTKSFATPSTGSRARVVPPTGSASSPEPQMMRPAKGKAPDTSTDTTPVAGSKSAKPKNTNTNTAAGPECSSSKSNQTKATPAPKPKPAIKSAAPKVTPKVVLPKVTPAKGASKAGGSKAANTSNEGTTKKVGRSTRLRTSTKKAAGAADPDYDPDDDDVDEDDHCTPASKSFQVLEELFKDSIAIQNDANRIKIIRNNSAIKEHQAHLEVLTKQNALITNLEQVSEKFNNKAV